MARTLPFSMTRDINGYNGFGLVQSNNCVDTQLAATVAQSTTVPNDYEYYLAIFYYESGSNVFVSNTGTADLPGSSFASTDSVLNPAAWLVKKDTTLSFITRDTNADVTVAYYAIPYLGAASI
jgi:hypothetical protein